MLKIFPDLNSSLRERVHTCFLASLNDHLDLIVSTSPAEQKEPLRLFPEFYHMGLLADPGPVSTRAFVVTEFIRGESLWQFHAANPLDVAGRKSEVKTILSIFAQILAGLKKVHELTGFLHLDLHPGNIMVSTEIWPHGTLLDTKTSRFPERQTDIGGTPRIRLIDPGCSGFTKIKDAMQPEPESLQRKITKVLYSRSWRSVWKYWLQGGIFRDPRGNPDIIMWSIMAREVLFNEMHLPLTQKVLGCTDYDTCLDELFSFDF